ncbi:homocysteine S-methyltransferase [Propioniciclava soli]|uniref:Homocysteine S-methyltransferase n=1 Tax=Propioniciclava soli TaxID=2775081 RepID=A0ABZ3C7D6_9ACTN|nr:homocysteine S-methyltransferase [Propioniciclava soli]
MTHGPLSRALADGPVILDGGLATLLEARGHDLGSALWSARLLIDDPGAIVAAHAAYFEAGAQVATAASYQASHDGFAALGLDRTEANRMLRRSVKLARTARDEAQRGGWVAASVGPYGAVLADGSEYRGDYGLTVTELRDFHRPRLAVLADAEPDVLALETLPCLAEVEAVLAETAQLGIPAWLSVTVANGRLRSGESVAEAFALAADAPHVLAVGVNCSAPGEVLGVVEQAVAVRPGVAYPNSGQQWDATARAWVGASAFDPALVRGWVDAGARLVGGCCRVGPAEIRAIADALHAGEAGFDI